MSVTYNVTQNAIGITNILDTTTGSYPLGGDVYVLLRFTMPSTNIYFVNYLRLTCNFVGIFGSGLGLTSESYKVSAILDPNAIGVMVSGVISDNLIPLPAYFAGTADYVVLSSKTITSYDDPVVFDLDLSAVTRIMTKVERVGSTFSGWNGHLILWITADESNYLGGINAYSTLTTSNTVTYANRFTGLQGPWDARSRVDECPVCGHRGPREEWAYSPWHKRMVCSSCTDPADPYDTPLVIEGENPLGGGEDV